MDGRSILVPFDHLQTVTPKPSQIKSTNRKTTNDGVFLRSRKPVSHRFHHPVQTDLLRLSSGSVGLTGQRRASRWPLISLGSSRSTDSPHSQTCSESTRYTLTKTRQNASVCLSDDPAGLVWTGHRNRTSCLLVYARLGPSVREIRGTSHFLTCVCETWLGTINSATPFNTTCGTDNRIRVGASPSPHLRLTSR